MNLEIITAIIAGVFAVISAVLGALLARDRQTISIQTVGGNKKFSAREIRRTVKAVSKIRYQGSYWSFSLRDLLSNNLEFANGYFDHVSQVETLSRPLSAFFSLNSDSAVFKDYFVCSTGKISNEERQVRDSIQGLAQRVISDLLAFNLVFCRLPPESGGATRYFLTDKGIAVAESIKLTA